MALTLLIISLVAAALAVVLLILAARQDKRAVEAADSATSTESTNSAESERYSQPVLEDPEDKTDYDVAPATDPEAAPAASLTAEPTPDDAPTSPSDSTVSQAQRGPEPTWETFPAQESGETEEHAEPSRSDASQPVQPAQATPRRAARSRNPLSSLHLPGTMKRLRREWAEEQGFDFAPTDSYLEDEWFRGAASTGATPKDIVSGSAYGHEMLVMDLGGVNVMAMRTGAATDEVVDFRRAELEAELPSEDLLQAVEVAGFTAFATDVAVAQRMVDVRVETALEDMPAEVTAVWIESDWVLAQYEQHSRPHHWEATRAPLAMLADASRVLPPRSSAAQALRFEDADPSRDMPAKAPAAAVGLRVVGGTESRAADSATGTAGADSADSTDGADTPPVKRPDEPSVLPSRKVPVAHGEMEQRPLGGDEVDAIADGNERPQVDDSTPRVPRNLTKRSTIFDDLIERYGDIMSFDFDDEAGDSTPHQSSQKNPNEGNKQ
ncbi:hypothetical protein H0194_04345 [Corynebacterium incognita]|uniref:Uncharacterized protein n=1 Tax=Corynebacterium incognita TaxID=2754725 RepID=A0A7G7CRK1_9CORY|nr:hypothetical protein [Corynebacterium incognita]QNE90217.1 hypothetical protein H0194_04345 [Corynebacterium incognita]